VVISVRLAPDPKRLPRYALEELARHYEERSDVVISIRLALDPKRLPRCARNDGGLFFPDL